MNQHHSGIGMTSQRTRQRMVERLREAGIKDELVLSAMLEVPRHLFVDEALATRAYEDVSLPIGFGQTILPSSRGSGIVVHLMSVGIANSSSGLLELMW